MTSLSATQLASELNLSKGRVSQYVSSGKLDGCFVGEGRSRRFDLDKVRQRLGKRLDPGQMLGNGATTNLGSGDGGSKPAVAKKAGAGATTIESGDEDAYKLVRTQKAQEELRVAKRRNEEDEGNFVLASAVTLQTRRLIAQEIAEFEGVLKEGARMIADELGVDVMKVRSILLSEWRKHRTLRSKSLADQSAGATMTETEQAKDTRIARQR